MHGVVGRGFYHDMTYVEASAEDVRQLLGNAKETIKAIAVRDGEKTVALIGLALEPLQNRFFAEYRDLSCADMKKAWRGVLMAMRLVRESRRPVAAVADGEQGHKNLKRLGFIHIDEDYYLWHS